MKFRNVIDDTRGVAAIEFALLAPTLILLMMGVLTIGVHMQSFNSVRSIAFDANRYTVVEYQKNNKLDADQIEQVAKSIADSAPYSLPLERLTVAAAEVPSGITGAKRFNLTLTYVPLDLAMPMDIEPPTITKTHAIIVPDN